MPLKLRKVWQSRFRMNMSEIGVDYFYEECLLLTRAV